MRKYFIDSLVSFNKSKKNIYLILNDLGFGVVEPFKKKYPDKVYNAGVSEQNMMGLAAGMASEKAQVFVYSIANFSTFRCAEQIRNDVDYHQLPVTIISVGSGLSYGNLGYSHHALQDYALMRSFPNTLIVSPGNNEELKGALKYIIKYPQPYYLRLDKDEISIKIKNKILINPGSIIKIHKGHEKKIILTTGNVQHIAKQINLKNFSIYSLPIWGHKTKKITSNQLSKFNEIITIEDHFEDGGFGSWVSECINKLNKKITIKHKFISTKVINQVGSKKFLMSNFGPGV
jgi:transketolase